MFVLLLESSVGSGYHVMEVNKKHSFDDRLFCSDRKQDRLHMVLWEQEILIKGGRNLSEYCYPKTEGRGYTNH